LRAVRSNIMAFTGLGSEEARSMARNSGFDLFLVKPVKFKDVEPLLRHLPVNSEGSLLLNLE
jgi:DNA-binding response OmpR family regulator